MDKFLTLVAMLLAPPAPASPEQAPFRQPAESSAAPAVHTTYTIHGETYLAVRLDPQSGRLLLTPILENDERDSTSFIRKPILFYAVEEI